MTHNIVVLILHPVTFLNINTPGPSLADAAQRGFARLHVAIR